MLTLANIAIGEVFRIKSFVDLEREFLDRLLMFGFVEGSEGAVKRLAPFGGPLEICIDDTSVSIRSSDANKIIVERI